MMEKLAGNIMPEPNSGCWIWLGATDANGYGCVYTGGGRKNKRQDRVHRVVYSELVGPIPDGYWIDHLCRNTTCCNPDHLEAVPPQVNIIRGDSPRLAALRQLTKTQCKKGHPYSGANLRLNNRGERLCVTCRRKSDREAKRRKYMPAEDRPAA